MSKTLYVRIDDELMDAIDKLVESTHCTKREVAEVLLSRALNMRSYRKLDRAIDEMITEAD